MPDAALKGPAPLLVLLHGSGHDGRSLLDEWQGFLIQPESGLLMQHIAIADPDTSRNADQISGMLSAICQHVQDAFGAEDTPDALHVGDLSVNIMRGRYATLAAVVRGPMPQSRRASFQATLDAIHSRYENELRSFAGDPDTLGAIRPLLASRLRPPSLPRTSPSTSGDSRQ